MHVSDQFHTSAALILRKEPMVHLRWGEGGVLIDLRGGLDTMAKRKISTFAENGTLINQLIASHQSNSATPSHGP
jgi:hypothetical protein